jgi:hypothetical protein
MVLLYSSEGIFGYFGFGPDNYIATAHLLLQGLSCSLLLLAFVPYNNKMMKKYLFIILAIMIHPSSLIYWGLSLQLNSKKYLSKISTNKKRVYLRCYQKIKIYMSLIIISYMIVLFYKIYLELLGFDGMNFDEKAFGVESPLMIIKSFLLILTTSILFKLGKYFMFKNKATTRSRDVKGEELIEFILNLFMNISIVSITMIPFSLGLSYRISYFIYISTPLCMIIISISIIYIIRQYSYIFLKNLERL